MRIISKFHDYYDALQAEGQDRALVFVREQAQHVRCKDDKTLSSALRAFVDLSMDMTPGALTLNKAGTTWARSEAFFGLVLFAGPAVPVRRGTAPSARALWASESQFVYGFAELADMLVEHDYDLEDRDKERTRRSTRWSRGSQSVKTFYALSGSDRLHAHATENALAALSYVRGSDTLTVNPVLADIQFYRQLATAQAYQELAHVPRQHRRTRQDPGEDCRQGPNRQHGFDRWSFRKQPAN